ncbi:MAG: oligosaccharide flippase family protein [Candidatus Omnitrophica bacterium]|nr:oligosaccharide flippase family protein [Candidatus Omnitrophota bacterium]
MTSKEQQVKNSFLYLLPALIDNLLPFLTLPIFSRILRPEDYGILALAVVFGTFGCSLANLALLNIYDRNFFQYRNDLHHSGRLLFSVVSFVAVNSFFLILLASFFQHPLSLLFTKSSEYGFILILTLAAECSLALRQYYLFYFKNHEDARVYIKNYLMSSLTTFVLSLVFVAGLRVGVIGLVYARLIGNIVALISLHRQVIRLCPFSVDRSMMWNTFKDSLPLSPPIFYGTISRHFDKYMVGLLSTMGGVGIYSIGQKMSYMVFVYMSSLQNVFQPQVYKRLFDLKENAAQAVGQYLTPFIYLSILIGLVVALFAEEVIWLLTPPEYHGAITIVMILAMYYGFLFWGKINSVQLLFKKKTALISLLTFVTLVLNILLGIPMIRLWGASGAAWNMFLVGLLSGGITMILAQKSCWIQWEIKKVVTIYLVFFGSALLAIFLREWHVAYVFRLVSKALCLLIYFYLGRRWGIFSRENFYLIRRVMGLKFFVKNIEGQKE